MIIISIQSSNNLNKTIIYSDNKEINLFEEDVDIKIFNKCSSYNTTISIMVCVINVTKYNTQMVRKIISDIDIKPIIILFLWDNFEYDKYKFIYDLLEDFFNESKTYLNDTLDLIDKCSNISSSCVLDNVINILKYYGQYEDNNISFVFENICDILNYPELEKMFNSTFDNNFQKLFYSTFSVYLENSDFSKVFSYLKNVLNKYSEALNTFIYITFKNYKNFNYLVDFFYDFFTNNQNFTQDLKEALKNETVLKALSVAIYYEDDVINGLKNSVLSESDIIEFIYEIIHNKSIINAIYTTIRNAEKGYNAMNDIPYLITAINDLGAGYFDRLLKIVISTLKKTTTLEAFNSFIMNNLVQKTGKILINNYTIFQFDISQDCSYLINSVYFSNLTELSALRSFYIAKIVMQTKINKNELLFYESCLKNKSASEMSSLLDYNVQPAFIFGIVDDIENKTKLRRSILNEKYNYLLALCLPYGIYKNSSENNPMCTQKDYDNILRNFLALAHNMNTSRVSSMKILDIHKFTSKEYIICIMSILIAAIPLIIILFLYIYKKIKSKNNIKGKIINQLKTKTNRISSLNSNDENSINNSFQKIFIPPKWYKLLKGSFDLTKNFNELFNFEKYRTNFNNILGLTYIKGIQGIAMILYIFGQTFLTLCNLPIKEYKIYQFYSLINHWLFPILFIGLRYCPRIIFSCSGYTFTYKYLCFLEQGHDYYFFKFLFSQSHKYILLIYIALFMRYSIYYIDTIIWRRRRPMLEIFKYNFENSTENYIEHLFMCLMYYLGDEKFENRQNIIQYFYVPLNEIFFFIFGTILISLGYKFKIKIDFFIVFIFFFLYLGRFFMFTFELMEKGLYPTLFFYLFGYGARMINPFYNLPDFLIGMYFGIINYIIQRGVIVYKKERHFSYSKIWQLRETMIKKVEENNNDFNEDEQINLFESSKEEDEIHKFGKSNLQVSLEEKETNDNYSSINNIEISKENSLIKNNKSKNEINGEEEEKDINDEYDEKMKEMPFLIFPAKFLYFHRKIMNKCYFKVILVFVILLILIFPYLYRIFIEANKSSLNDKNLLNELSLENVITNYPLNIIFLLDMEIVVFVINWGFFIIYSKKSKNSDLLHFFSNAYWSFFTKSYFSFISISSPVIIYIFYQSETVIELNLSNTLLYSFINLIFILIAEVILYICYELPLKKIFKTFTLNYGIANTDYELNGDDSSSNASNIY